MNIFEENYARVYDVIYQGKNYSQEVDEIERCFRKFVSAKPKTILDLGCGTGGHLLELAKRGYLPTGIDLSENMLEIAAQKLVAKGFEPDLHHGDICELELPKKFDAVICMFAVLCYQLQNELLEKALKKVSRHLKQDGVFIFDFWYGPAVLNIGPEVRRAEFKEGNSTLIRTATPKLNTRHHLNEITYHLNYLEQGEQVASFSEIHQVRYFFPLELEYFLSVAGLELCALGEFPKYDTAISDTSWNAIAVARKKKVA
jgi:SAM-dependent methyltransferase